MKFSHTLALNSVPEWKDEYVDFVSLKKLINKLDSQKQDNNAIRDDIYDELSEVKLHKLDHSVGVFLQKVETSAMAVAEFYDKQRSELDSDLSSLQTKTAHKGSYLELIPLLQRRNSRGSRAVSEMSAPELETIRREITDLYSQYHNLKTYAKLNCEAIRKIIKKYDKIMNDSLTQTRLSELKTILPFWNGCLEIEQSMEVLKEKFAYFFTENNKTEASRRLDSLLRESVSFQRRSVWLDVNKENRRREQVQLISYNSPKPKFEEMRKTQTTWQIIMDSRQLRSGIFSVLVFLGILTWPGIFDEDPVKRNALAMSVFVSLLWATEVLPLFVTAMVVPFLAIVLRVIVEDGIRLDADIASRVVFSAMFSHVILLLIGGFSIAAALSKHNIAKIAASYISRKFGTEIRIVLMTNMFFATFISMWISNVAAPVLCFSLIEPILKAASAGKSRSSFGTSQWVSAELDDRLCKALIMGIALASNVGGMASPISSPQNLFAIEYASIGWLPWFAVSIPVCIALDLIIWAWLAHRFKLPHKTKSIAVSWALQRDRSSSEILSFEQYFVIIVSVGMVFLWCSSVKLSAYCGEMGVFGIIPFVLFFGTGVLSKDDLNNFLWSVVILAQGGLVLGEAIKSSGKLLGRWSYDLLLPFSSEHCC
jgi:phosphate transporter